MKQFIYNLLKLLLFMGFCYLFGGFCWLGGRFYEQRLNDVLKLQQKVWIYDKVIELQKLVGAKQDGKIGIESMTKINGAVKAEEPNRFNFYAEPYFTSTGAPIK